MNKFLLHDCKELPLITLCPSEGEMFLKLRCTCTEEDIYVDLWSFIRNNISIFDENKQQCEKHQTKGNECQECINSYYNSNKDLDFCQIHNLQEKFHCMTCHRRYCYECKKRPPHSIIVIKPYDMELYTSEIKSIKEDLFCNEKYINEFIEIINDQLNKEPINSNELIQIKQEILLLYNINNSINQDLLVLMEQMLKYDKKYGQATYFFQCNTVDYELLLDNSNNVENINDNFTEIKSSLLEVFMIIPDEFVIESYNHPIVSVCLLRNNDIAIGDVNGYLKIWRKINDSYECLYDNQLSNYPIHTIMEYPDKDYIFFTDKQDTNKTDKILYKLGLLNLITFTSILLEITTPININCYLPLSNLLLLIGVTPKSNIAIIALDYSTNLLNRTIMIKFSKVLHKNNKNISFPINHMLQMKIKIAI